MKFLRIEKSLTSAENVVLTIVNRREGATLLNVDECHSVEVRAADLIEYQGVTIHLSDLGVRADDGDRVRDLVSIQNDPTVKIGTHQGL